MILSAQFLLSTAQSAGLAGLIGRLVLHVGVPMEPFPSLHNSCPLQPQPPAHVVHFYERDFFPAQSIANFFCAGLETGEVSLIIATAEHTRAIKESLEYCGLDPDALERADLLLCLDAPSILAALGTTGALTGCGTD